MHVAALALRDFRSYAELDLALDPGVSVLVGANGQGKTNVVEALQYLATLGSHRVATDAPLVREGCSQAHLAARLTEGERSLLLEVDVVTGGTNRARVNRAPVRTTREVVLHNEVIPERGGVVVYLAAGNRDERVFKDPDTFDIHREDLHWGRENRSGRYKDGKPGHLGFGIGQHFCMGYAMARQESAISCSRLMERITNIRPKFADHPGISS